MVWHKKQVFWMALTSYGWVIWGKVFVLVGYETKLWPLWVIEAGDQIVGERHVRQMMSMLLGYNSQWARQGSWMVFALSVPFFLLCLATSAFLLFPSPLLSCLLLPQGTGVSNVVTWPLGSTSVIWLSGPRSNKSIPSLVVYKYSHPPPHPLIFFFSS